MEESTNIDAKDAHFQSIVTFYIENSLWEHCSILLHPLANSNLVSFYKVTRELSNKQSGC